MSDENEIQVLKTGGHTVRFEPPDLFVIKMVGDFTLADMLGTAEFYKRAPGKFYLLGDLSEMGTFSSEAKKAVKEVPLASGVVLFGASRQVQLVMSLLTKVYMMVNMGKAIDIKFMATEAEGRRYIDQLRRTAKK